MQAVQPRPQTFHRIFSKSPAGLSIGKSGYQRVIALSKLLTLLLGNTCDDTKINIVFQKFQCPAGTIHGVFQIHTETVFGLQKSSSKIFIKQCFWHGRCVTQQCIPDIFQSSQGLRTITFFLHLNYLAKLQPVCYNIYVKYQ